VITDFGSSFVCDADAIAIAVADVATRDAVAIPLLDADTRRALMADAETLPFRQARPVIGEGDKAVHQEFKVCLDFPQDSLYRALSAAVEDLLNDALGRADTDRIETPLRLNDLILQRYEPGCLGITPHRDHIKYTGLVAIVVICGDGRFCLSDDRAGQGVVAISAPAGHILIMRGPGFSGQPRRPFHFLDQVTERRYSFGLRQDSTL
jgi:hypothetical protein